MYVYVAVPSAPPSVVLNDKVSRFGHIVTSSPPPAIELTSIVGTGCTCIILLFTDVQCRAPCVTVIVTVLSPDEFHFTVISLVSFPLIIVPPSTVQLQVSPVTPAVSLIVITVSVRDDSELIQTVSLPLLPPTAVTITGIIVSVTLNVIFTESLLHAGDWSLSTLIQYSFVSFGLPNTNTVSYTPASAWCLFSTVTLSAVPMLLVAS